MAVIIQGIDIPKKHYMNGYYISDDGKVFDVSRKIVVGKAVQIPDGARLIDGKELRNKVLKWLPLDPCGVEEKEFPFETDICVSTLMEIDEAPTIFEEEK